MRANHVISALVFALAAACADSTSPERGQTGELTAQLRGGSVLLHNGSQQPVHFALNGEEDPTRILWLLCAGPQCPALAPGADDSVALAALDLTDDAKAAFVHWWHAESDGEGHFRPDSIRTISLAL
jgi:hypothetical protein